AGHSGELALIGHSGGGVAAVHAAHALHRAGASIRAVAMIGSPKAPIPRLLRPCTVFLHSKSPITGRHTDPVARLGAFRGLPAAAKQGLPLIGGHRDYFRSREPFVSPSGLSNLDITTAAVLEWLLASPGCASKG